MISNISSCGSKLSPVANPGAADVAPAPNKAPDSNFDRIIISDEARQPGNVQSLHNLRNEMAAASQQEENTAQGFEIMRKVVIIASRIAAGDNVPPQDRAFLLENSPGHYMLANASAMRRQNQDPRNHDSVLCADCNNPGPAGSFAGGVRFSSTSPGSAVERYIKIF